MTKAFIALTFMCIAVTTAFEDVSQIALKGAHEFLRLDNHNQVTCYTITGAGSTRFNHVSDFGVFSNSNERLDNRRRPLEVCTNPCCFRIVVFLEKGLGEIDPNWSHFRLYVLINLNASETPEEARIAQDNVVLFHRLTRQGLFAVYQKKAGKMEVISLWNGETFSHNVVRSFRGVQRWA